MSFWNHLKRFFITFLQKLEAERIKGNSNWKYLTLSLPHSGGSKWTSTWSKSLTSICPFSLKSHRHSCCLSIKQYKSIHSTNSSEVKPRLINRCRLLKLTVGHSSCMRIKLSFLPIFLRICGFFFFLVLFFWATSSENQDEVTSALAAACKSSCCAAAEGPLTQPPCWSAEGGLRDLQHRHWPPRLGHRHFWPCRGCHLGRDFCGDWGEHKLSLIYHSRSLCCEIYQTQKCHTLLSL